MPESAALRDRGSVMSESVSAVASASSRLRAVLRQQPIELIERRREFTQEMDQRTRRGYAVAAEFEEMLCEACAEELEVRAHMIRRTVLSAVTGAEADRSVAERRNVAVEIFNELLARETCTLSRLIDRTLPDGSLSRPHNLNGLAYPCCRLAVAFDEEVMRLAALDTID